MRDTEKYSSRQPAKRKEKRLLRSKADSICYAVERQVRDLEQSLLQEKKARTENVGCRPQTKAQKRSGPRVS